MNSDCFDKTDHNKKYVNNLRDMANSKSQESNGCDCSSEQYLRSYRVTHTVKISGNEPP